MMSQLLYPSHQNGFLGDHISLLTDSFMRLLKRPLINDIDKWASLAEAVFNADFVLLSHDTSQPPVFNYANKAGMTLFEMDWETFTSMPSKYSAEPDERDARERLLKRVSSDGYIDDYSGVRISKSGRRFRIAQAVVWTVSDNAGRHRGQAACFSEWDFL